MKPHLLLIFILSSTLTVHAQHPRWTKTSGNWSDPAGWSTGQVPPREETVEIGIGCEVIVTTEIFAGIILVNGQGKVNVATSGILHVNRSGDLGGIKLLDKSQLIVSGQLWMGDRYPLFGDAIQATFYRSFRWESPDIIVNKTGLISIGNTSGVGIFLFTGGSITNHGTIQIGNFGPIGYGDGANVTTAGIFTVGASFTNTGIVTVDDVAAVTSMPNGTPGIVQSAGFTNTGQVRIGQKARVEGPGMIVGDTTTNAGLIAIDNAQQGFGIDTLINTGQILVGQNVPVNRRGIFSDGTRAYIMNQGDILVDNIVSGDALGFTSANIINQKNIFIGKTHPVGGSGFGLSSGVLDNRDAGFVQVQNCGNHNFRLSGGANLKNTGRIEVGGDNNTANDAINLNNATFTNNAGGVVRLDKARKNGVRLVKARLDNRGTIKLMASDSIPVLLQNLASFNNMGTLDISESEGMNSAGIAVTGGSTFNNESGAITLYRPSVVSYLPAVYIRDERSTFRNRASLTIGDALSPLLYHAIQADQKATFINERQGFIKVGNTQQNGLMISNGSSFTNTGTVEMYNVGGVAVSATNQSGIDNDGIIKTGIGSIASKESIYLDGNSDFENRPHGEVYINRTDSPYSGLLVKGGTVFQNNGKVVWGNESAFLGKAALQLSGAGIFNNRNEAILEFNSAAGDAIVCDAVAGAPQNSNFTNDGVVRFGNINGRGFYNIDPSFAFRNNNLFETLPGGKMNLQALVNNAPSSKLNNADGTVTTGFAFTNSGTIINNGTWNASAAFDNNGRYQGSGLFQGVAFNNKSIVAPGNSPGCASFGNGFTTQPGSALQIEINGKDTPCTQFDQVNVTGTATISGQLNVTFGGGYTPGDYDMITILKSTTLTGTFNGSNLPAGWTIVYNKPAMGDVTVSRITALPLHLVRFGVQKEGNMAHASWTTTEEVNTSHFDLERSADGKQFEQIATITAQNAAGEHLYDFTDLHPLAGRSYYRLKMADIDDTYTHSRIVSFDGEKNGTVVAAIYPNPAKEAVNIQISESSSDQTIRLISQSGKTLLTKRFTASGTQPMDVSAIPAGIYIMKVSNGETYKLVKQ